MDLTILLSKVFGIYFVSMGVFILFRRSYFKNIINLCVEEPLVRFMVGIIMFIGGLFLIIAHQDWSSIPAGFISLMGWAVTAKALIYMNLSNRSMKKWVAHFKLSGWYGSIASLLAISLGLYLLNFGFGW